MAGFGIWPAPLHIRGMCQSGTHKMAGVSVGFPEQKCRGRGTEPLKKTRPYVAANGKTRTVRQKEGFTFPGCPKSHSAKRPRSRPSHAKKAQGPEAESSVTCRDVSCLRGAPEKGRPLSACLPSKARTKRRPKENTHTHTHTTTRKAGKLQGKTQTRNLCGPLPVLFDLGMKKKLVVVVY